MGRFRVGAGKPVNGRSRHAHYKYGIQHLARRLGLVSPCQVAVLSLGDMADAYPAIDIVRIGRYRGSGDPLEDFILSGRHFFESERRRSPCIFGHKIGVSEKHLFVASIRPCPASFRMLRVDNFPHGTIQVEHVRNGQQGALSHLSEVSRRYPFALRVVVASRYRGVSKVKAIVLSPTIFQNHPSGYLELMSEKL